MTYLDETRYHWFSMDSSIDLSAIDLSLSTDGGTTWVVAQHSTEPASAADYPPPEDGQTRYWWRALFGPTEPLVLSSVEQEVEGMIVVGVETLTPVWTIFSEGDVEDDCWPVDTGCLGDVWDGYPADVQRRAAMLAVETLRMLTGYRVGGCPVTVRPCARGCFTGDALTGPTGPGFRPSLQSGSWINTGCVCGPTGCSCGPVPEIRLPSGAGTIVSVSLDGATLDPSTYRLDWGHTLVRTDGGLWPVCQNMLLAPTEDNTFAVTYVPGVLPGTLGSLAAGRLAGEFAKACMGESCALPARASRVARSGVTIDLATAEGEPFPSGFTGLRDVDVFIQRHNPHRLAAPSAVWYPGQRNGRYTGGGTGGGGGGVEPPLLVNLDGGAPGTVFTDTIDGGTP